MLRFLPAFRSFSKKVIVKNYYYYYYYYLFTCDPLIIQSLSLECAAEHKKELIKSSSLLNKSLTSWEWEKRLFFAISRGVLTPACTNANKWHTLLPIPKNLQLDASACFPFSEEFLHHILYEYLYVHKMLKNMCVTVLFVRLKDDHFKFRNKGMQMLAFSGLAVEWITVWGHVWPSALRLNNIELGS